MKGGFQLLDLIITELKSQIPNLLKIQGLSLVEILFVKENPLQDLLSSLNALISNNERTWFITGHVTFKLCYNQI